jgi:hypothetical protein
MLTYADFTIESQWDMQLMRIIRVIKNEEKYKTIDPASILRADSIPCLPQPYFAHFFDLHANFTGRERNRQMLSEWLKEDKKPIFTLVAIGGMGKSSLAWYWLRNDIDMSLFEGIMWWSFYDSESSFSKFLDEAIIYVSNSSSNPRDIQFDYDKVKALINLLNERRFLFIFDGFEKQLGIYESQRGYVENSESDEFDTRTCIDPKAAYFLRSVAAGTTQTKLLVTTRAMIRDLEDNAGTALDGCCKVLLNSMSPDDAIKFMHAQGVSKGSDSEINIACRAYGYHPLSLRYLSGLIIRDKKNPGDISVAPHYDEHIGIKSARDHILEATYNALPERYQTLLSKIASLRGTSYYDTINLFNDFESEGEFEKALDELIEWSFLLFEKERGRFDMHPIVRKYAYSRLSEKEEVHNSIRNYFIAKLPPERVHTIEDLALSIDLYYHTAKAGMYDEASQIYIKELSNSLFHRFGAYLISTELLKELFPNGLDKDPPIRNPINKREIINCLGISYFGSGKSYLAIDAFKRDVEFSDKYRNKKERIDSRICLADQQMKLGQIRDAENNLRHRLKGEISTYDEATLCASLGLLFAYEGLFTKSAFEFKHAQGIFIKLNRLQPQCAILNDRARFICHRLSPPLLCETFSVHMRIEGLT